MADLAIKTKAEIFDLIRRAAEELYPDASWTGLRTGTFEWLLAQIVAEVSTLNGEYLELRANNAYLETANVRKDVRDITSNLGLFPSERAGATVALSLVATDDVTVPKGSQVVTSNGEVFSTLDELVLSAAGSLTGDVNAIHADYESIAYRARGDAGEVIDLNKDDILVDNLTVTVDGVVWTKVDNLFGQSSTAQVYRVVFDERNRVSIRFGNGIYGRRLAADANIIIDVYSGGGPAGNSIGVGELTSFLSSFVNSSNVSSVTNAASPSGGDGADSLDDIAAAIPAQLRQIAGLINSEDMAQVIKANLSFVADANAERKYQIVNNTFVPTVMVSAYPNNDTVVAMSSAQSTELSNFLTDRGQLGVVFTAQDAYAAPIEIEIEVRLSNKNLEAQKTAEIKAALTTNSGAPFAFKGLGFNVAYKMQDILNIVEEIDGVLFARLKKFSRVPHALVSQGFDASVNGFADIELGDEAEDGYFQFRAVSSSTANVSFFRPFKTDSVGVDFIRSSETNWLKEEYSFTDGGALDDTNGPYIKISGNKLVFNQISRVWKDDQWNGSTYKDKYLLRVQYVNSEGVTVTSYYHVNDTSIPGTITTLEDADSPISGTAILATLADSDNTNIVVQILEDQETGASLLTQQGQNLDITHNDKNTLYLDSDPSGLVPISQYSYIHFNENPIDTSTDSWIANTEALKMRLHVSEPFSWGDIIDVYTTKTVSDRLYFKHPREVYTLSDTNITIRFI
jgi:hypothetical protein